MNTSPDTERRPGSRLPLRLGAAIALLCCIAAARLAAQARYPSRSPAKTPDDAWLWMMDYGTFRARRAEGKLDEWEFSKHGSRGTRRFVWTVTKQARPAATDWIAGSRYGKQVLFAEAREKRKGKPGARLWVWLGEALPVDMARIFLALAIRHEQPKEIILRTSAYKARESQMASMSWDVYQEQEPASRKLIAKLLDRNTSQRQFFALIKEHNLQSAPPPPKPAPDGLLARYTFDGHYRNAAGNTGPVHQYNAPCIDNMLFLNGDWFSGMRRWETVAAEGYQAYAELPGLNLLSMTCTILFYPMDFRPHNCIINFNDGELWSLSWFSVRRHEKGHLIARPKGFGTIEFPGTKLSAGEWHIMTCGYDTRLKRIKMFLDGRRLGEKPLPADGILGALLLPSVKATQCVAFQDGTDAAVFWGLIDELTIHNGYLADADILKLHSSAALAGKPKPLKALKNIKERELTAEKGAFGDGVALCTPEMLEKGHAGTGKWTLRGKWFYPSYEPKPGAYNLGGTLYLPVKLANSELKGFIHIPEDAPDNVHIRIHWNSTWAKGDSHFSYTPRSGAVTFGKWGDPRAMRRLKVKVDKNPVPFCVRVRDRNGVLFLGDNEKPVARVSGLTSNQPFLALNLRNAGKSPVRFGHLRTRFYPPKEPLDKPIPAAQFEPPEMPAFDDPPTPPSQ